MGLLSYFKRAAASAEAPSASSRQDDTIEQARARARHRLIGAVVLVGVAVIGFPLLFETEPRPVPTDLPIEIPAKDAPMVRAPAPSPAPAASVPQPPEPVGVEERAADVGREVSVPQPPVAPPPASAALAQPRMPAVSTPSQAPAPARDNTEAEAARARALLEGRPAAQADEAPARYVVQVGAYSETASAREVRAKVEKLGFKTYTQVVDTAAGQRIRVRVGPFASREKAQQAADRLKAAGLPGAVLTL
ncbi:MAG: SPOR domain-containing protein [Caldimonas sp.]|uniref:SPOR domain-containing protein n=1 Tax=Caldimonas sp. TaxID=2838790 RepID=UPI0039189546